MKVLFAATPVAGHLNPLLAIAHMLLERGDDAALITGTYLKPVVEKAGVRFLPLAPAADLDLSRPEKLIPEEFAMPAGPERMRQTFERAFLDPMPAQLETLRAAIAAEKPDIVIADNTFFGRMALFLDPARPPVPLVACGVSALMLDRSDGAPFGPGLPPARDDADRARYAAIAAQAAEVFDRPVRVSVDRRLAALGLPPIPHSMWTSMTVLADMFLHPTVPAFEYDPGRLPDHVRFVGPLPPPPSGALPIPDWWTDIEGDRRIVLVTQGTAANVDFGELVEPTLKALADRNDLLVLVTTGKRPLTDIRGPIPSNARLAEFLNFEALLPKIDVLVTNGGYGTVSQALRAGVPIVAAGRTADKGEVGARVAWADVGIEIPTQRPGVEELRAAIGQVLAEESYRERAKAMAADMAAIDTHTVILDSLADLIEHTKRPAGAIG